jgi:hypothetical protein
LRITPAFLESRRRSQPGGGTRPPKITLGEMRASGVRGLLIDCEDYRCSHSIALMADRWSDDLRLSDIEPRLVCTACGKRGAEVRAELQLERPREHGPSCADHTDMAGRELEGGVWWDR